MKINKLIVLLLSCLLLVGCNNRPRMAYDQKDKGAVQDIEVFDVETSAENFRKTSKEFKEKNLKILNQNTKKEMIPRRVALQKKVKDYQLLITIYL